MRRLILPKLYPLTDARLSGLAHAEQLRRLAAGGATFVQLREKHASPREFHAAAEEAVAVARAFGVAVIVNDRADIALAARADGVHLGQDDLPAAEVRALVGDALVVGLSTHAAAEIDAAPGAVDYIGVGPVHATPTKPGRPAVGLELVRHAAAHASVPWFAIGGIDETTAPAVVAAGARRLAVVRAIAGAADPGAAARGLRALLS